MFEAVLSLTVVCDKYDFVKLVITTTPESQLLGGTLSLSTKERHLVEQLAFYSLELFYEERFDSLAEYIAPWACLVKRLQVDVGTGQ